ncbi:MAG: hypothetical protein QOF89_5872 [Acidobacteriota bacterium]|jgi:hypothetical protein|nr:hypothetical protein [Acidobacteriota bacterium]
MRLPGRNFFPGIDDHLVKPEVTRDEIIAGRRVVAQPAELPHADEQTQLDYVLRAHAIPGYGVAADLLTRHAEDSDFASDACVYRKGVDPETGARYLEEVAFEIVSEQKKRDVTEKAELMHHRGVRRIFAIFVKGRQRVCEWLPESRTWRTLDYDSLIEDPRLVRPLVVSALLDAATADHAVIEALAAKGDPTLQRREDKARSEGKAEGRTEGREEGRLEGRAEFILTLLEMRGLTVSTAQRQEILSCYDLARLDRWLHRAAVASSVDKVLSEP